MQRRKMRGYQQDALKYMLAHRHAALFMKMRLGKTLVVIRRLNMLPNPHHLHRRFLVVAPYDALSAWEQELALEGERSVVWLTGTKKERSSALATPAKWFLFNKEGFLSLPEVCDVAWDAVVLDESTFIKNPKAKVSKFYCEWFRGVPHRVIMTGTPNPEGPLDFFQQFKFLDGGHTFQSANYWNFRVQRFRPMGFEWVPASGTERFITDRVSQSAFILSRKDVSLENPRVYEKRVLALPPGMRKTYRTMEDEMVLELNGKEEYRTMHSAAQFAVLRRLCGGFIDAERMVWDGKIAATLELLRGELAGEPVVVWAFFNAELEVLYTALRAHSITCRVMRGDVPKQERRDMQRAFSNRLFRVFLIQPSCVRYGVNLSVARTAIYFSTPVSQEIRAQTEDRILSVGGSPLLFIDMLVKDTVDEDAYSLVREKSKVANAALWLCRRMAERRNAECLSSRRVPPARSCASTQG